MGLRPEDLHPDEIGINLVTNDLVSPKLLGALLVEIEAMARSGLR